MGKRTFLEGSELEVADEAQQLLVRRRFPELAVGLGGVERILALEVQGFDDGVCDLLDADLLVLANYSNLVNDCEASRKGNADRRGLEARHRRTRGAAR